MSWENGDYSSSQWIINTGLTNRDSVDVRDMQGVNKDRRGTWCSSPRCCPSAYNKKGKLIHVGETYLKKCPRCNQKDYLYFDTLSKLMADKYRDQFERPDWIPSED